MRHERFIGAHELGKRCANRVEIRADDRELYGTLVRDLEDHLTAVGLIREKYTGIEFN